jgi:EAL domain-containing protein (putative c-di-GMP-specific phosphodiesterase class I)
VEDEACLSRLRSLGCEEAQGYSIARPMEAETLLTWLRTGEDARPAPRSD